MPASGVFVASLPERTGWLAVSLRGKWKVMWCTLRPETLYAFINQGAEKQAGCQPLVTINLDQLPEEDPRVPTMSEGGTVEGSSEAPKGNTYEFRFSVMSGSVKYELAAPSEEEMQAWMDDIARLSAIVKYVALAKAENGDPLDEVIEVIAKRKPKLDLGDHFLTINGVRAISAWMTTAMNTSVTALSLHNCGLTDQVLCTLHSVLSSSTVIQALDFSHNGLTDTAVERLAQELYVNITLTSLNLNRNHLGPDAAKALADLLGVNETLVTLDLSHNDIGAQGASCLAGSLALNVTLETLDVSSNRVGDSGVMALAAALPKTKSLTTLLLDNNGITDQGFKHLSEALGVNESIAHCSVAGNHLTEVGAEVMVEAIKKSKSLVRVNFGGNAQLGTDGMMRLSELMGNQFSISKLKLSRP